MHLSLARLHRRAAAARSDAHSASAAKHRVRIGLSRMVRHVAQARRRRSALLRAAIDKETIRRLGLCKLRCCWLRWRWSAYCLARAKACMQRLLSWGRLKRMCASVGHTAAAAAAVRAHQRTRLLRSRLVVWVSAVAANAAQRMRRARADAYASRRATLTAAMSLRTLRLHARWRRSKLSGSVRLWQQASAAEVVPHLAPPASCVAAA